MKIMECIILKSYFVPENNFRKFAMKNIIYTHQIIQCNPFYVITNTSYFTTDK